jgi:hypothetical protein
MLVHPSSSNTNSSNFLNNKATLQSNAPQASSRPRPNAMQIVPAKQSNTAKPKRIYQMTNAETYKDLQ